MVAFGFVTDFALDSVSDKEAVKNKKNPKLP